MHWFEVEDSREGWAKAVEFLETMTFQKVYSTETLVIDFSKVRGKGSPIMGMQGRPSSGPVPLMDDYAKPMAERVYGDAALPPVERNAALLARYIFKQGLRQINKRELKRSPHKSALPQLRVASVMDAAVEYLVEAGWLMDAGTRQGGAPGRPTATYLVNPAIHGDVP